MKIVKITKLEDKIPTWDLEVKNEHHYLMENGVVSHNTISYIVGCEQSIEPNYSALFVYSTLSGEFIMANEWLVKECKERGIWNQSLVEALKQTDGDVEKIVGFPEDLVKRFKTAFAIDYHYLVDCASVRQHWIDQAQSFNLYNNTDSLKYLNDLYMYCWKSGLKTTYYLRNKAASKIEKISMGTQEQVKEPAACSIEAMKRGEVCESCS